MSHKWKNIVVFFNHSDEGRFVLNYAGSMAEAFGAFLTGICVNHQINRRAYNSYVVGAAATEEVLGKRKQEQKQLASDAESTFDDVIKNFAIKTECRTISNFISIDDVTSQSFYCDVVVLSSPTTDILPTGLSPEQVLLSTGVPIIIVPPHWQAVRACKKVLIAWNASTVARRAVVDALPMLMQAESVRLLIVDNQPEADAGREIAGYLNYHGVKADVKHTSSNGDPVSQVIIDQAEAYESDMIVIGAYSRSRFSEMLLGGVTKALLSNEVSVPVFISR